MMDALGSMFGVQGVSPGVASLIARFRAGQAQQNGGAQLVPNAQRNLMVSPGYGSGAAAGAVDPATFARVQGMMPPAGGAPGATPMTSRVGALANLIRAGRLGAGNPSPPITPGYAAA